MQAWKQDRLDLAEHFFVKLDSMQFRRYPPIVEKLIDLILGIGTEQLNQKHSVIAVKWLGRAFNTLQDQSLDILSHDAGELRLHVLHTYGTDIHRTGDDCTDESLQA